MTGLEFLLLAALKPVLGHATASSLCHSISVSFSHMAGPHAKMAIEGIASAVKSSKISHLACSAVNQIQTLGFVEGTIQVVNMLIIIGLVATGTKAFEKAQEALYYFSEGDFEKGLKAARKAVKSAKKVRPDIALI